MASSLEVCKAALQHIINRFDGQIEKSNSENPFVIGIGSGSTIVPFVSLLVDHIKSRPNKPVVVCIPTSEQARFLILNARADSQAGALRLGTLDEYERVDVTVDGADAAYLDEKFLIKGGGAAHCQEKIVCEASEAYLIVISDSKKINKPFESQFIPIEVIPSALSVVKRNILSEFGSKILDLRLRTCPSGCGKIGPIVTDNGNLILDLKLSSDLRKIPAEIDAKVRKFAGVLETGVFWRLPHQTRIFYPSEEQVKEYEF